MCGQWSAAQQYLLYIGRVRSVGSGLQHNNNCYVQEGFELWAVVCSTTVTVRYRKG